MFPIIYGFDEALFCRWRNRGIDSDSDRSFDNGPAIIIAHRLAIKVDRIIVIDKER